ncbi:MAG: BREX system P-loop protein BrxC, partial [Cyanobacteria bacterium J06636_28]
MGSAGKHLASGERSLLDAFQIAAKAVADESLGVLVPFHTFYLAIEGFLDSVVSQVIAQAQQNSQLQPFDVELLKTLFMVKYVKEVGANLDNLTTLSLKHIDQDKNQLKADVEASLARLEKQTLIQRAGDSYSFLTNEEQDIGKEIKNTEINPDEVTQQFQRMIWENIFTDKKLKFSQRHQYGFNRKLNDQAYGQQVNDFGLHVITSYADRYPELQEDTACLLAVSGSQEVLVRLPEDLQLVDELVELVKTDKYIRTKNSGTLTPSVQQILTSRRDENSKRQERILSTLRKLVSRADVFAANSKVDISQRDAKTVLTEGLMYLVENVYTKLNYVSSGFEKDDEVTNAFTRDSAVQLLDGEHPNGAAHQEMMSWLMSERRSHRPVTIRNLVSHFAVRPYGWSELDTLGILAELVNLGKAELRQAQASVNAKDRGLITKLRSKQGMDSYLVQPCDEVDPGSLAEAKRLGSDGLLSDPPPS